jgi:predicted enzyme related to lactoylglutathione lyase
MSRIVHIAIKVDDLEKSTKFYEDVFGIYQTKTGHARGHTSRHMTDGNIDFAIMTYDSEDEAEAKLIGKGPGIHHYGVEVEDREATMKKIEENGGKIFSDRGEGALKFQAPDGNYGEIVGIGRYKTKEKIPNKFVHLALKVDDVAKARKFYENVFGFTHVITEKSRKHTSCHLSDGFLDFALMQYDAEDKDESRWAGDGPRIHHTGIEVPDQAAFAEKIKAAGGQILSKPGEGALKFRAPDGTLSEIVKPGRYEEKKARGAAAEA